MKKIFLIIAILFQSVIFSLLWGKDTMIYSAQSCISAKNKQDIINFNTKEVTQIVNTTGMDQRSLCSFITLGSRVYPLAVLKEELLKNTGDLKKKLNEHYLFPESKSFFQDVANFLFSNKYSDSEQVLNTIVLNDLLYGYNVGETIPVYMEEFLYYATVNKAKKEKEAMNKIMPYILYVEGTLLNKKDFTPAVTEKYIQMVQKNARKQVLASPRKTQAKQSSENILQDNPYKI